MHNREKNTGDVYCSLAVWVKSEKEGTSGSTKGIDYSIHLN